MATATLNHKIVDDDGTPWALLGGFEAKEVVTVIGANGAGDYKIRAADGSGRWCWVHGSEITGDESSYPKTPYG